MRIRQEELIAFLLGDTAPDRHRAIVAALADSAELRERLAQLRAMLGHLESHRSQHEPPSGLADRTMQFIDRANTSETARDQQERQTQRVDAPAVCLSRPIAGVGVPSVRRSFWDSAGLSLSIAILACLFLPTILRARFESRRFQCADNLRYLGAGLISWANLASDQRFPAVPVEGPTAFSGIYAVHLNDATLLDSPSRLLCAGAPRITPSTLTTPMALPSISELKAALLCDLPTLQAWRKSVGGDYAYNLGVMESNQVVSPRSKGRTHFAILGDSPKIQGDRDEFPAHGRGALNVLYEDGHVEFVAVAAWQNGALEHPFRNQDGLHEVGIHINDASLAPSHFGPLGLWHDEAIFKTFDGATN